MLLLGDSRWKYAATMLCAAALGGIEASLHPLLMKAIFDAMSLGIDLGHFVRLVFYYLALGISLNVLGYLLSLWQLKLDNKIVGRASGNLLRAYFTKDYRDLLREGSGYYVARIRSDVKDGLVPMLDLVRKMAASISTFVALVSVLCFISWQGFIILSAIIPVATLVNILMGKKIQGLTLMERDTEAALLSTLTKFVGAFKMVSTFNMVPKSLNTFSTSMDYALEFGYKKSRVIRLLQGGSDLTMVISDACSIFMGALFVFRNQMTIGSFIAFMNAFWRSTTTLIAIFRQWAELHSHSATINRVVAFMDERPVAPYYKTGNVVLATAINYGYDSNLVISHFSMRLEPGENALIIGLNGSGKTTLANILAGYLPPSDGQLELPVRISAMTLPVLFPPIRVRDLQVDSDLLEKFRIGEPEILDSYPDQLSIGQQQKLSLALALSHDSDLYVLDEPLANLDVRSRSVAMEEIRLRTREKILVMIMHSVDEYTSIFDQVHILGDDPSCSELRAAAFNN